MVKQTWKVVIENDPAAEAENEFAAQKPPHEEHMVEYSCSKFSGRIVLVVDGEAFTVKGKPFGIGLARQELVLVGSSRGVLTIDKGGCASLTVDDAKTVESV